MFKYIKTWASVISFLATPVISDAGTRTFTPPKLIRTTYEVTKNGQPFAKVKEQFSVSGNAYKIESITKGIGIYGLFGERKLTSTGEVTTEGLKPSHFELQQGDNAKKALISDFDWPNKTLHMLVKGAVKDAALIAGTQDLASYAYQFMFNPAALKDTTALALTTGKKLNQYQYKINASHETITSGNTQYKTMHLMPAVLEENKSSTDGSASTETKVPSQAKVSTETKELWLSLDHYYLPVRIMLIDDNGSKLEQTLTDLHIE